MSSEVPAAPPERAGALHAVLRALADGSAVTADAAGAAFDVVMRGDASPAEVGALLMGLRVRGETAEVLAGVAGALRRAMLPVPAERPEELVDTCGTGGGTVSTFNISTAAALVAAGAGVRVAKHGNRSYRSRCGSADLLEALDVAIELPVEGLARVLTDAGIVFMFAPQMHPAMRHVGAVRRELGVPTVMNLVGPLANPAGALRQVVGVGEPAQLTIMAHALAALGTQHALVVYGAPGLDEISPLGPTTVVEVRDGREQTWTLDPQAFGLGGATRQEVQGGNPADNATLTLELLAGGERGPAGARSAIVLNAAAAIYVAGRAPGYSAAVAVARDSLHSGCGLVALDRLRTATGRERRSLL